MSGHGLPDGALSGKTKTVYALHDMAELAARMGSFVTFDRLGTVVWMDEFEGGLGSWEWGGSGANNAVYLSCEITLHGGLAALLHPGEVDDGEALIRHNLLYPVLGGIGFEAAFVPQANLKHVDLILFLYDGSRRYDYQARYDHVNGLVQVCIPGDEYPPVGAPGIMAEGWHSHCMMKVVANSETGKYARVMFNGHTYDASEHMVYSSVDTDTRPSMVAYVAVRNTGAHLVDVPVDCVIVTQNEPV